MHICAVSKFERDCSERADHYAARLQQLNFQTKSKVSARFVQRIRSDDGIAEPTPKQSQPKKEDRDLSAHVREALVGCTTKIRGAVLAQCALSEPTVEAASSRFGPSLAELFSYLLEQKRALKIQVDHGAKSARGMEREHQQLLEEIQQTQAAHADKKTELAAVQQDAQAHMAALQRASAELSSIQQRKAAASATEAQLLAQLNNLRQKYKTMASRRRALRARLRRAGGDCRVLSRLTEPTELKQILEHGERPLEAAQASPGTHPQADADQDDGAPALLASGSQKVRTVTWDSSDQFLASIDASGTTQAGQGGSRQSSPTSKQPSFQYGSDDDSPDAAAAVGGGSDDDTDLLLVGSALVPIAATLSPSAAASGGGDEGDFSVQELHF